MGPIRFASRAYSHLPRSSHSQYNYISPVLLQNQIKPTVYHKTGSKNMTVCPQHCYFSQFDIPSPSLLIQEILPFPSEVKLVVAEGLLQLTNGLSMSGYSFRSMFSAGRIKIQINQTTNPWQPRRKLIVIIFFCRMWMFHVFTDFSY